jgi:hypothetical protein
MGSGILSGRQSLWSCSSQKKCKSFIVIEPDDNLGEGGANSIHHKTFEGVNVRRAVGPWGIQKVVP